MLVGFLLLPVTDPKLTAPELVSIASTEFRLSENIGHALATASTATETGRNHVKRGTGPDMTVGSLSQLTRVGAAGIEPATPCL